METMALVLHGPRDLRFESFRLPDLAADEVRLKVHACGVCGTDIHLFHGEGGAFENAYPLIMGHEFSGTVEAVGAAVTHLSVGQRVAVDPNVYCGYCSACLRGDVHYCENMMGIGTTRPGGFAEHCQVPAKACYVLPEGVSLEAGAMMEPLSCCLHGAKRSGITPGSTVAIIGFGAIGQMMFQLAHVMGAARIIVVEPIESKRKKALAQGAALAVSPDEVSSGALANERIESVIECVGRKVSMEMAVGLAANQGTVMLFGLTAPGTKLEILAFEDLFKKELTLTASFINPLVGQQVLALLDQGRIDMDSVITDRIPLEDAIQVFTDDRFRTHGKILIGG